MNTESHVDQFPSTPTGEQPTLKELLRSRQRARQGVRGNPKSCLPCRERKVKCDKTHPCSTCSRRGHPDLCNYEARETSRAPIPSRNPLPRRTPDGDRSRQEQATTFSNTETCLEQSNRSSTSDMVASPVAIGPEGCQIGTSAASHVDATFFADTSVVNMARQRSPRSRDDPARQSAFETGILPLLGVNEEMSSSALSFNSLPSDQEIIRLFEVFRQRVHPFHVITCNLDQIERRVCALINARGKNTRETPSECLEDPQWLCLLHAILATGAQFSELPLQQRILLSQQHTKHSFDLLRSTDYLARPSKQAVQTLLLLGNALQNDMKPQAAWVLGGTTIRLAQCLGLHKKPDRLIPALIPTEEAKYLRLAIVWQDSLLALAFGRPPASHEMDLEEDLPPLTDSADTGTLSYLEAMNWLCHVILRHLSSRQEHLNSPLTMLDDMRLVENSLSPHLSDAQKAVSVRQLQEHYAFELHKNFVISTLCRPFISSSASKQLNETERPIVMERFQDSLRRSVRAYVRLRSITGHARRSWAFIHNGLTSVLLLSLMRQTRYLPETRTLQDEMIASLSDGDHDSSIPSHLSGTLRKALKALQTLQRLADRDISTRGVNTDSNETDDLTLLDGSGRAASDINQNQDAMLNNNFWNMEAADWNFPVDFDLSPLGAFDYIMSDQHMAGSEQFPNVI